MEMQRQQVLVERYHYDLRLPDDKSETEIKVGFAPIDMEDPEYPKENTVLGARLEFRLIFDRFIISGSISQINHLINRKVASNDDLTQEEINEITRPLFKVLERLTYEVTEITTDQPGIQLNLLGDQHVED